MIENKKVTETKGDKAVGVVAGLGCSIPMGIAMIALGLILSFTGIGIILGVPLMLAGILVMFIGPALGLGSIVGPCPYCGSKVRANTTQQGVNCQACKKRIIIRDKKLLAVE